MNFGTNVVRSRVIKSRVYQTCFSLIHLGKIVFKLLKSSVLVSCVHLRVFYYWNRQINSLVGTHWIFSKHLRALDSASQILICHFLNIFQKRKHHKLFSIFALKEAAWVVNLPKWRDTSKHKSHNWQIHELK